MITQILRVLNVTTSKHLLKAIISPGRTLKAVKYHYRRVSEREFIEFFVQQWSLPSKTVDTAFDQLNSHKRLWKEIEAKLTLYPNDYGMQMTRELRTLYLLVRILKPRVLVETGVASGASSAYILCALEDNKQGRLFSIDLPPENLPEGKKSGWVVPEELRSRWSLYIKDSKNGLKPLLKELIEIDCFVHDSLHTYEHMMWEFNTAWDYLRPGGLFLSHDVGANDAFSDFMKDKAIPWSRYRVFHVLGGFRRPIPTP